ncbi:MerR family DNA-binding transcriptional regulator [Leucobacter komagatae]|uniref:MerR family transcriptional regulator n=1 Tax=Leucobacter komagatae TaxID=55969 RepID=A0A0D0IUK4_9MICO|nr:MerR family DNA-binding transcriptional regulator [Leucobacter komagatae]KIP53258.1 MerR family transcriptional regulator [Leucobacter komagatae]
MDTLRPADLARDHGLSTQAVRNYERDGCLPPAERTASGYRIYTGLHALALRAFLALVAGFGHAEASRIMRAVHRGDIDQALDAVAAGYERLRGDRTTLLDVRAAVDHIALAAAVGGEKLPGAELGAAPATGRLLSIGEVARMLGVSPATLRTWERVGILRPKRDPATRYRVFGAADQRDARLASLLRRGGYPLAQIRAAVTQIRDAGGTHELLRTMLDWHERLNETGLLMLRASGALAAYLHAVRRGE